MEWFGGQFNLVLLSTAVACGLTTVLAALLVVAERYLVSYGTCSIDVNEGSRQFEIRGGANLLTALKDQKIFIPSACGGRGTCAYCKVTIREGGGPVGPTEEPLLTEEEITAGMRISCQCKVRNDLQIAIPEPLLSVQEFTGVVRRIRDLTHDIKELRIELVQPERIKLIPGQYIQLEAPPYGENPESVSRAYSVSSPPSDDTHIELVIRLVPGGICTTWVFTILKEGDQVTFTGPFGDFRLTDTDKEMIWIAGGSGMAPFWSMVRHLKEKGNSRPCTYFFGAVGKRDLFYLDELNQLAEELSWFRFVPALSGDVDKAEWSGETGLITEVVERNVADPEGKEAYLCGSPGMIDAAIEVLHKKGFTDEVIFYDKFE